MSWRTTGILFLLLVLVGGAVYWQSQRDDLDAATPTPALAPGTFSESVPLLPDVAREDVVRLEISRFTTGEQVVYEQEDGIWTRTVPTTTQVISSTVNTPLQSFLDASSRRTLPPDANPAEVYGLAEPRAMIIVAVRRPGATVRHTFNLGNLTPAEDAYYLEKVGDPRIHIVTSFAPNNILDLLSPP